MAAIDDTSAPSTRIAGVIGAIGGTAFQTNIVTITARSARPRPNQATASKQVNAAADQFDQMTQQKSARVEQSAAAADSLKDPTHK